MFINIVSINNVVRWTRYRSVTNGSVPSDPSGLVRAVVDHGLQARWVRLHPVGHVAGASSGHTRAPSPVGSIPACSVAVGDEFRALPGPRPPRPWARKGKKVVKLTYSSCGGPGGEEVEKEHTHKS